MTQDADPIQPSIGTHASLQHRLIGLLDYIEHVEKLNRKPALTVPTDFYCGFEGNLRGLHGIEFDLDAEGDEIWLRVPRLVEKEPPQPPASLLPWVVLSKNPDVEPQLREEVTVAPSKAGEGPTSVSLTDRPELPDQFAAYLDGTWKAWALAEQPRRRCVAVYNNLYSLHQSLEAEGAETPIELVWGIGIAIWRHSTGAVIRHPIITQPVEVNFNKDTLALEVQPRDRPPFLETDSFAELNVPGVVHVEAAWRGLLDQMEETLSPFKPSTFEGILKASVGFLDSGGQYRQREDGSTEGLNLPIAGEHLVITDTWVLFARKRSPNFLIEDLERLRKNLQSISAIPVGPAALVSELANEIVARPKVYFRGLSYSGDRIPDGTKARDLFFPKPYNDEQVSIVEKLEGSPGVVVQGPPGTGKTHTIANVICHYLANGKRVLVTSKGEPALAVLRDQIPESIRALTVALLTDEKDGMRQFEHAIQSIASTVSRIQPDEVAREITSLSREVDELHSRLASTDTDIARWANKHLQRVRFADRTVMPDELARMVVDQEKDHNWFPDILKGDFAEPPMSEAEAFQLRTARKAVGADLVYLDANLPDLATLPTPAAISSLHDDLLQARVLDKTLGSAGTLALANRSEEVLSAAEQLVAELTDALVAYERVYQRNIPATEKLHGLYSDGAAPELETLDAVARDGMHLEKTRQKFVRRPIEVPEDADIDDELAEAVLRCKDGKAAFGLLSFGKSQAKTRLAAIRVTGTPPTDKEAWEHVQEYLNFRRQTRQFVARWNATAAEFQLPVAGAVTLDAFKSVVGYLGHVASVRRLGVEHRIRILGLCKTVFGYPTRETRITMARASMTQMRQTLQDHLTRLRLDKAVNDSNECLRKLARHSGPVVDKMSELLRKELGNDRIEGRELAQSWGLLVGETSRLGGNSASFRQIEVLTTRIAEAGAAKWAKALRADQFAGDHDVWLPPTWLEAWTWRQAATFVDSIDGRKALRTLQTQRKSTEVDLARAYQKLVENKTWLEVYNNSPPAIKAALQAYLNAIRRIGKGTGIRAIRFRKEARAAMLDAYRAVPCWILPQWRVSETLPPEIGRFDLVIIDEASQSDIWALPALIRGAKLMVVGDDKQVSPDGIGLAEERIKDLKNRFLKQQIHGNQMTPEKSLYDLAKVVFAGEMVMLREHFRCVAPIIEFSKREFYNHEIRPLRIPKGSERLDPPLIDVFVRGGSRSGKTNKVNQAEARAIVDEMKTLIGNPRYDGRSMGVVSLLGIEQAHRIFELIREEVPPEEVVARKITVGDARTFQGKERDIMFLSMVATPDENTAATAQMFEQRFNVAASRAKDRMYLFRSVEVSDLSKVDLKARLIEHFRAPFHQDPVRVASLRELCESDFERDMFDVLTKRNYQVQPQVQVGGYRIDLVVNGHEDRRLAIECDGDKYHGPEQWSHDMARQRILERAGWTFWRCFGASFFRNRDATLDDLISTLTKMGIEPLGAAELDLGRYTEHREVSPLEQSAATDAHSNSDELTPSVSSEIPEPTPPARRTAPAAANPYGRPPAAKSKSSDGQKREILSVLAGNKGGADIAAKASVSVDSVDRPSTASLAASVGMYSDVALAALLERHSLKSEDRRRNGGALWIYGDIPAPALRELKSWGFQYAPTRVGWWKK